jgi:hypothetical protein
MGMEPDFAAMAKEFCYDWLREDVPTSLACDPSLFYEAVLDLIERSHRAGRVAGLRASLDWLDEKAFQDRELITAEADRLSHALDEE